MEIKIKPGNLSDLHGLYLPVKNPRACIILVHGLGEHINRYMDLAEFFNDNNYSFIGLDLPGHGKSPGKRGHIVNFQQYNTIIDAMTEYISKREQNAPLVLYGHSLGGTIALKYLIENDKINRGIITSPWLKLSFEPHKFKVLIASALCRVFPSMLQPSGLDPRYISTDESVTEEYRADPMNHSRISLNLFSSATVNAKRLLSCSNKLQVPVLLIHSNKDRITSAEGSQIFAVNNNMTDLKIWEKGYHELHHEVFRHEVLEYIINWLNKQYGIQNED